MSTVVSFPDQHQRLLRAVPGTMASLREIGLNFDEAKTLELLEGIEASRAKRRAQIEAGMSKEERLDLLALELHRAVRSAPGRELTAEERQTRRAALEEEARSNPMALLALDMIERYERQAKEPQA